MIRKKKDYIIALNNLTVDDPETAHMCAEVYLLEFLKSIGHSELVDAFECARDRCSFWYTKKISIQTKELKND